MLEKLKHAVLKANLELVRQGLVVLTWGNASAIDRQSGLVIIKPSGVDYDAMAADDMVVVDLDGHVVEGRLQPSSDLATHLALYLAWPQIGGISHTHSVYATIFAQAEQPIPCLGTTHADHFHGEVPVTRALTPRETLGDYEGNTGEVIVECLASRDPEEVPGVLVAHHGPFTWGKDAMDSARNAVALEQVARMTLGTWRINPDVAPLASHLLDKHYRRKHGAGAYYGQPGISSG